MNFRHTQLQQPPAQEGIAGNRPAGGSVAAVLDHLVIDVPGAEQAEQAGVGGRDQDGPLAGPAGAKDVVTQDVRVDHDRRRAQQDVSRERALGTREPDGRLAETQVRGMCSPVPCQVFLFDRSAVFDALGPSLCHFRLAAGQGEGPSRVRAMAALPASPGKRRVN